MFDGSILLVWDGKKTMSSDIDFSKFDLNLETVVRHFSRNKFANNYTEMASELFSILFDGALESELGKAVLSYSDEAYKNKLVTKPYRVRRNGNNTLYPSANDNLKEIIDFLISYYGSSSYNIINLIEKCKKVVSSDDRVYDFETGFTIMSDFVILFKKELSKLIDKHNLEINEWQKNVPDSSEIIKLETLNRYHYKLYDFWNYYMELVEKEEYGVAFSYLVLYSLFNSYVVLLNLRGGMTKTMQQVSTIEADSKYVITSALNTNMFLGSVYTNQPLDIKDEKDGFANRELLCTRLNTNTLDINNIVFELEIAETRRSTADSGYYRLKLNGKYMMLYGMFRRSYIGFTENKKADGTVWKIEFSDSLDDPYVTISPAGGFPRNWFKIDIPNGNMNCDGLLLWVFIGNDGVSQRFYLNKLEEEDDEEA